MHSFEDVRAYIAAAHTLTANEPYLISFDLALPGGRRQGIYLAELDGEDDRHYLRISSLIAALDPDAAVRALRFNWAQRVGYLAVNDVDGAAFLHLCENRPYQGLSKQALDAVIAEIGDLADRLESLLGGQGADLV
ncbi:MAG: hypothetical protein AB7V26_00040 [Lysobacterales bacterium]